MTDNLIEPNKVCVNNFHVIPIKFTLILSGKEETWSKLMAVIVCFQSHFITEGKSHIFPPPIITHTFPYPNFSFQESLFSLSCPFHPCSTLPVQTGEPTLSNQSESTNRQPGITCI